MASQFDESDFIDREYQSSHATYSVAGGNGGSLVARPPSREELDTRVSAAQQKLAELRRAQEELERERTALEEARRRRVEFQTGREEMLQCLTRGVSLMEQAEFNARRDVDRMAKTLAGLRESLAAVQGIHEDQWTEENWNVELTRALAAIENGRMEWNRARLSWEMLNGTIPEAGQPAARPAMPWGNGWSYWELCKLGAALTWPIALIGLLALVTLLIVRIR